MRRLVFSSPLLLSSLPSPLVARENLVKKSPTQSTQMSASQPPSALEGWLQSLRHSPPAATDLNLQAAKELQEELAKYIAAGSAASSKGSRPTLRLGVLGSTRGTALQAVLDAISSGTLNAKVEVILSNVESAGILERASKHHIKGVHVSSKGKEKEAFDKEVCVECGWILGVGDGCCSWCSLCAKMSYMFSPFFLS